MLVLSCLTPQRSISSSFLRMKDCFGIKLEISILATLKSKVHVYSFFVAALSNRKFIFDIKLKVTIFAKAKIQYTQFFPTCIFGVSSKSIPLHESLFPIWASSFHLRYCKVKIHVLILSRLPSQSSYQARLFS